MTDLSEANSTHTKPGPVQSPTSSTTSTTSGGFRTHAAINSLPVHANSTPTWLSSATLASSSAGGPSESAGIQADVSESGATRHWKLVGVSVIIVSAVAMLVLSVAFYDQWTAFVRDLLCGWRVGAGSEELLPDWEKRSWEYGTKEGDGESVRFPAMASANVAWLASEEDRNPFPRRPQPALNPSSFATVSPGTTLQMQHAHFGVHVEDYQNGAC
jgi:hypothetical protein